MKENVVFKKECISCNGLECVSIWYSPPPRRGFLSDFRFGITDDVEGPGLSSSCLNIHGLKNVLLDKPSST